MNKRKLTSSDPHATETIELLRADRAFAVEYVKSALEELGDPERRSLGLLALRNVAAAYGGVASIAKEAGLTREALYRALSPSGNPTLKTLLAVLHAVGMKLSVVSAGRHKKGKHLSATALPTSRPRSVVLADQRSFGYQSRSRGVLDG